MSVNEIGQLHSRYVRLSDKFKSFWTYNQFAAGAYKHFLERPLPYKIDFQKIYDSIRATSDTIQASSQAEGTVRVERAERELNQLVRPLIEADEAIKASTLRRFLEKLKQQDEKIIFNLIKFYLYTDAVEGDQRDKLDFLFTKIGEDLIEEKGEYWSKDSQELRQQFQSLVSIRPVKYADEKELAILIRTVRQLRDEVQAARTFDELNSKNLLEALRAFKQKIGDQYFHPDVLLAIVDCNVTTKNRFMKLYREEEQTILDDASRLLDREEAITRRAGEGDEGILDELARFRRFKQEFEEGRTQSNVKFGIVSQLKASMNTILAQLDRGLESPAAEDSTPALLMQVQSSERVNSRFGDDRLLQTELLRMIAALDTLDPHLGEERIASAPEVADFRLEPWEVGAYLKVYASKPLVDEETEELMLLFLRAAALRLRIDDYARQLASVDAGREPDPMVMQKIGEILDRAKEYDQLFGDFLHEGIYYSDAKILHRLYRSRFRLLRGFSGLWLIYDQRAERAKIV